MSNVQFCKPNIVWDIAKAQPKLFKFLDNQKSWHMKEYEELKKNLPAAETFAVFDNSEYFRPAQHYRAFYKRGKEGDVLAFKGSEVIIHDIEEFVLGFSKQKLDGKGCLEGIYSYSILEHFPLIEQKIPCALLLKEATQEAQAASDFQLAYFNRYGELAQLPVPLLVHQWSPEVVDNFLKILKPLLSLRAYETVKHLTEEGLAYYIYYFPHSPKRVRHLGIQSDPLGNIKGHPYWMQKLKEQTDPEKVISGWIQLIARMLALGYLPFTLSHRYIGQCIEEQNAVVNGGFVDVDSIRPIHEITDEREFYESVFNTLITFSSTLKKFLLGNMIEGEGTYCSKISSAAISNCLWDELKSFIKEEEKKGYSIDPRIYQLMFGKSFIEKVSRSLSNLYPEIKAPPEILQKFFSHV